jgi:type IV pilus assembly protein PilM
MLGSFGNIFGFGAKKFLGIDIGTSSIRIVELMKKKKALYLSNYGELQSTSFIKKPFKIYYKDSVSLSNKEVGEAIKAILEEAQIETRETSLAIPDFSSFFTSFEIPTMTEEEIGQTVQYEVRPYIPLPLSEVTLDWIIIGGEPSKTPLKVLVVAIPNDAISQYREIAETAQLELKSLESEVFALARSAINFIKSNGYDKKTVGLIDIGARSTTCSILENGILKSSYSFKMGGNDLTEVVAKSLNIDYNKAEGIKVKYGLTAKDEINKDIRRILIPLIDSIMGEVKESFRAFYLQEGKEIEGIVLCGGIAAMPGLKEYLSSGTKKEVVIANPFSNINYPSVIDKNLKEMSPSYAIAVGLALHGLE